MSISVLGFAQQTAELLRVTLHQRVSCLSLAALLALGANSCIRGPFRSQAYINFSNVEFRNQTAAVPSSIPVRSRCFWLGSNEVASFSWEAVATGSVQDQTYRLAACTNTDPDTGQPVVIDGQTVIESIRRGRDLWTRFLSKPATILISMTMLTAIAALAYTVPLSRSRAVRPRRPTFHFVRITVQDPGRRHYLHRASVAFGFGHTHAVEHCADPLSRKGFPYIGPKADVCC